MIIHRFRTHVNIASSNQFVASRTLFELEQNRSSEREDMPHRQHYWLKEAGTTQTACSKFKNIYSPRLTLPKEGLRRRIISKTRFRL